MKKGILAILVLASALTSCTENERGTATVNLPQGQKLVNIAWKQNQIWYLTRPMYFTDSAETYTFQKESSYGFMEGTVVLKESK